MNKSNRGLVGSAWLWAAVCSLLMAPPAWAAEATLAPSKAIPLLLSEDQDELYRAVDSLLQISPARSLADVPNLIRDLQDDAAFVRYWSAIALGRVGPPARDAVPALIKATKDDEPAVRVHAALALSRIAPEAYAVATVIAKAIDSMAITVPGWADDATADLLLKASSEADLVAEIKKRLHSPDDLSLLTILLFGELCARGKLDDEIDHFVKRWAAADPRQDMRDEFESALFKIGPRAIEPLIRVSVEDDRRPAEVLEQLLSSSLPSLIDVLGHEGVAAKVIAERALLRLNPRARYAIHGLDLALHDSDRLVREAAVMSFLQIRSPTKEMVVGLPLAVFDGDPEAGVAAARAIETVGPAAAEALPVLYMATDSDDPQVCVAVGNAIRAVGGDLKASSRPLIEGLRSDVRQVRLRCARSLWYLSVPPEWVVPEVEKSIDDCDLGVRRMVALMILRVPAADKRLRERIVRRISEREIWQVLDRKPLLRKEEGPLAGLTNTIIPMLDGDHRTEAMILLAPFGRAAIDAAPRLATIMGEGHDENRRLAAECLVAIGKDALPKVLPLIDSSDSAVRVEAAKILWDLGECDKAFPTLLAGLADKADVVRNRANELLFQIMLDSPESSVRLVDYLKRADSSSSERAAAVRLLGVVNPQRDRLAIEALIERVSDRNADVREAAACSLGELAETPRYWLVERLSPGTRLKQRQFIHERARRWPEMPEAVRALVRLLREDDVRLQAAAISALGAMGRESIFAFPLIYRFASPSAILHFDARNALAEIEPLARGGDLAP